MMVEALTIALNLICKHNAIHALWRSPHAVSTTQRTRALVSSIETLNFAGGAFALSVLTCGEESLRASTTVPFSPLRWNPFRLRCRT